MTSDVADMVKRNGLIATLGLLMALGPGTGVGAANGDSAGDEAPLANVGTPADVAFDLGYDIESMFRFVADEIRYEPYVGVLRGAQGTLAARAGNSLDQALLLAALLDESAVAHRFVRGSLDEDTASRLIESIATDEVEARSIMAHGLVRGADALVDIEAAEAGATDETLADFQAEETRSLTASAEDRIDLAGMRLEQTVSMIESALDEVGFDLPIAEVSLPQPEVADHTWLQVPFGAEWLDLDPTGPSAEPGATLTQVTETLQELPDDLRHQVTFEVLVETVQDGHLVTETILSYTSFADEIAGVPVAFSHLTPSTVEQFGLTLLNVLGDGRLDYRPTFDIGQGSIVSDQGVAFGLSDVEGGGGLLEGSELFDDDASSTDGTGLPDGEATAEWLTVTVGRPGAEPVVARRTVFDRLPAQLRQGGEVTVDAVAPIELIDFDGSGASDFLPMLGVETFSVATGPTSITEILTLLPQDDLGAAALAYHGLRDALGAGIVLDAGARTFIDGPNIVSFSLRAGDPEHDGNVRFGLDIWHREHGVLPLAGSAVTVAQAELIAGVTGHIAEQVALESLADTGEVPQRVVGVGRVFEAAAEAGVRQVVLHGAITDPLPYGPRTSLLIEEAVGSGDVVVIPEQPVAIAGQEALGWWRIDPATGAATDVMHDASGSEAAEYEVQMGQTMRYYRCNGPLSKYVIALVMLQRFYGASIAALDQGVFDRFVRPRQPGRTNCWTFTMVG